MAKYILKRRARSLFATRTFKRGIEGMVGGILPILIVCAYGRRYPTVEEALAIGALLYTFVSLLVGRVETSPVYTPDGLPGPNKSKFEGGKK